jgi:hypothetical protein
MKSFKNLDRSPYPALHDYRAGTPIIVSGLAT